MAESLVGKINAYVCESCGGRTVTIHRDDGVTPFITMCRKPGCEGDAVSEFYRGDQNERPTHEWYTPDAKELATCSEGTREHVSKGGVILRPIRHETREAFGFGVRAG